AGGDVGHLPGRLHVAVLAMLTLALGRAFQPFAVGLINVDAEDHALVAGGTIAAFLVERRITKGLSRPHGIIKGAEEKLRILRWPEQSQSIAAETRAELIGRGIDDLVTIVAMDAPLRNAAHARQIILDFRVAICRGMA